MTSRRAFIGTLGAGFLSRPLAVRAQDPGKVWRIGFMEAGAPAANRHFLEAFKRGLRELGYVDGQNVVLVERWADGQVARYPEWNRQQVQAAVAKRLLRDSG